MAEKQFVNGLIIKAPRENAPDFVKANISIKREELIEWLQGESKEWLNLDALASKKDPAKWYCQMNNWEGGTVSSKEEVESPESENLPF